MIYPDNEILIIHLKKTQDNASLQHPPSLQAAEGFEERVRGETWVLLFYEQSQDLQLKKQGQTGIPWRKCQACLNIITSPSP